MHFFDLEELALKVRMIPSSYCKPPHALRTHTSLFSLLSGGGDGAVHFFDLEELALKVRSLSSFLKAPKDLTYRPRCGRGAEMGQFTFPIWRSSRCRCLEMSFLVPTSCNVEVRCEGVGTCGVRTGVLHTPGSRYIHPCHKTLNAGHGTGTHFSGICRNTVLFCFHTMRVLPGPRSFCFDVCPPRAVAAVGGRLFFDVVEFALTVRVVRILFGLVFVKALKGIMCYFHETAQCTALI